MNIIPISSRRAGRQIEAFGSINLILPMAAMKADGESSKTTARPILWSMCAARTAPQTITDMSRYLRPLDRLRRSALFVADDPGGTGRCCAVNRGPKDPSSAYPVQHLTSCRRRSWHGVVWEGWRASLSKSVQAASGKREPPSRLRIQPTPIHRHGRP